MCACHAARAVVTGAGGQRGHREEGGADWSLRRTVSPRRMCTFRVAASTTTSARTPTCAPSPSILLPTSTQLRRATPSSRRPASPQLRTRRPTDNICVTYLCNVVLPDPVGTRGASHREERPCGTHVQVKGRGPASRRAGPRPLNEPRYERRFFDLGLFRPDAGRRGAPG